MASSLNMTVLGVYGSINNRDETFTMALDMVKAYNDTISDFAASYLKNGDGELAKHSERSRLQLEQLLVDSGIYPKQPPHDTLHDQLVASIREFKMSSFENFEIDVWVFPAENTQEVYDATGKFMGYLQYTFQTPHQPEKTMDVRQDSTTFGPVIWFGGQWSPVPRFLQLVKPAIAWNDLDNGLSDRENKRHGLQQQSRWWDENGKCFPLVKLPGELRNKIYRFALGDKIVPFGSHSSRPTRSKLGDGSNANFLLVSRLVYKEVSHQVFTFTPFHVEHYGIAARVLREIGPHNPPPCLRIRQLELALSHADFFKLFGGSFDHIRGPSKAAMALRTMKLSKLQLKIEPPSFMTSSDRFDDACQKTAIEWIFEVAWPAVRGHPVEISGFVRKGQKVGFEAACAVVKKDFEMWQKQRVAVGLHENSLKAYDEWVEEMSDGVDGGTVVVYGDGHEDEDEYVYGCADQYEYGYGHEDGHVNGSMVEYEDGHVDGDGEGDVAGDGDGDQGKVWEAGKVTITPALPACECKIPCSAEYWTAID